MLQILELVAWLKQNNNTVGLFSAKLNECELNYTVVEKETLVVIKAVQNFRSLIFKSKITIMSDNANIIFSGNLTAEYTDGNFN